VIVIFFVLILNLSTLVIRTANTILNFRI